jgi:hypothetical protein
MHVLDDGVLASVVPGGIIAPDAVDQDAELPIGELIGRNAGDCAAGFEDAVDVPAGRRGRPVARDAEPGCVVHARVVWLRGRPA